MIRIILIIFRIKYSHIWVAGCHTFTFIPLYLYVDHFWQLFGIPYYYLINAICIYTLIINLFIHAIGFIHFKSNLHCDILA